MATQQALEKALSNPALLAGWAVLVACSLAVLVWDLRTNNDRIDGLMRFVWGFTVLYSGPLGLAGYWWSGRRQIPHDSIWRRAFRSVSHCYSGCGTGEVLGVTIAVGVLALGTTGTVALTFACPYVIGYLLTVGPLMQDGVGLWEAVVDAFYSETASITVMRVVAIGVDVWLAGDAGMGEVLFWAGLVFSLSVGSLAVNPVNVLLIWVGVKEWMGNPAAAGA